MAIRVTGRASGNRPVAPAPEPVVPGVTHLADPRWDVAAQVTAEAGGTGTPPSPVDLVTPVADDGLVGGLHVSRPPVLRGYVAGLATTVPLDPDAIGPVTLTPGGSR